MRICLKCCSLLLILGAAVAAGEDYLHDLQQQAIEGRRADFGHWGWDPDNYLAWSTHSNRLIPVYTFGTQGQGPGIALSSYMGENSCYRRADSLEKLYGCVPVDTLCEEASSLDQTNIFDLQRAALKAGKKHIILVVFDGTDWQTTQAASIYRNRKVAYTSGRGTGLHLQDYRAGGTTEFGWMVTSPYVNDVRTDLNLQTVTPTEKFLRGGYAFHVGGKEPWIAPTDRLYPIGRAVDAQYQQAYTDSSSSATSMTAGIKTFNASVNVDIHGNQAETIAHLAQKQGYSIGVITSVSISHATPSAAYAHNVERDDYQDLTRDLLGLPSVSHPDQPLPGVDLLMGCGWGIEAAKSSSQGKNFVPGNLYLTEEVRQRSDVRNGGNYVIVQRERGVNGWENLKAASSEALDRNKRLFGFFGTKAGSGHLPFRTADGNFNPAPGKTRKAESYTPEDLLENPTLAQMTEVGLDHLQQRGQPFWLMVEAGDVDWSNHDNNIDNSIGAVFSGDDAVRTITDWVEKHSSWDETVMIVTADHGHYLVLERPELLIPPEE